ncbi:hypothetical protein ITJ66_07235 [Plantibacter sp. VKM Ac-2885]|uniref:HGGxSTG domain-containing protein n=1 Tax=Plantibacter sp. VKM Ac-2885 TaxID=2783828 RepID=UPI00188C770D|nr:HGGxSTG domain-containing protein [Plantibacter sp. VKM Ac-2885]MBF4512281.1 hypothetical protein [Plantibacter sp. VKM Ac-2885]
MNDLMHEKTLCTARKRSGQPCGNAPMLGSSVCRMHGGAAPQVKRRAQQRILEASDKAAFALVQMMQDVTIPPAVRVSAARDLLDRAGLVSKAELSVEVSVSKWDAIDAEILVDVATEEDIIDAELVHDNDEADADELMERRAIERRVEPRRVQKRTGRRA